MDTHACADTFDSLWLDLLSSDSLHHALASQPWPVNPGQSSTIASGNPGHLMRRLSPSVVGSCWAAGACGYPPAVRWTRAP